jgi:hypothetical protein
MALSSGRTSDEPSVDMAVGVENGNLAAGICVVTVKEFIAGSVKDNDSANK